MIKVDKSPIFSGELGEKLYKKVCDYIEKLSFGKAIKKGVLVGFSGGADSVFLLEFLNEYRKKHDFKILAVHVNHSIRGKEADSDEAFSSLYAKRLGVEFVSKKVDAKAFSTENHISLEEAARNLRYAVFQDIIRGRNDISTIAVAHNASDNFETVLFNMMRGAGLRGLSGITPFRDNIIRPLLSLSKSEITELLDISGVKYVTDSTNFSTDYTRNYIRHEIVPKFSRLSEKPSEMITRLTENLREDDEFIEQFASDFVLKNINSGKLSVNTLLTLHPSPLTRVIGILAKKQGISLEKIHIEKIAELLPKGNFTLSLPSGYEFVSESGSAYISYPKEKTPFFFKLSQGINFFPDFNEVIVISDKKIDNSFSNVYKIAIQASFNFDIMNLELCVRSRSDGDSYRFDGMTHKLKKMFNDKKIPPSARIDVPVLCDSEGIAWVPGFKRREGCQGDSLYVAICKPRENADSEKRSFYILT